MFSLLMVAEKPSIARTIAESIAPHRFSEHKGKTGSFPVYEFESTFFNQQAHFKVTSVCGHMYSTDFPDELNNWDRVDPLELYDANTVKKEVKMKGGNIYKHLRHEAKSCSYLVLWLDCDREGENICFEVIETVADLLKPSRYEKIYRAKFSSLTATDIRKAMREENLVQPNENESLAVDARQILDLKIGVTFTRLQTQFFQGKYGNLDSRLLSYGPCQTPTLGFCVKRYDEILNFKPEPYYLIDISIRSTPQSTARYSKGRIKSENSAQKIYNTLSAAPQVVQVVNVQASVHKSKKPQGMNTVSMLKLASNMLGMSPHHAMSIAEHLYLSGYITYPRTETTAYASSFDLKGLISSFTGHSLWGDVATALLRDKFKKPHKGLDAGDHPPITPCRAAAQGTLRGDEWLLYDLVVRHFLATVSPDATYEKVKVTFQFAEEIFEAEGTRTIESGFSALTPWACGKSSELPSFKVGETFPVIKIEILSRQTEPPGYITESELLEQMEHHGIGTDASMPMHISNICERNYVRVENSSRRLIPTKLGLALVHGYYGIDKDLVLPSVRSDIEKNVNLIAKGRADFHTVVNNAIALYKEKFRYFRDHILYMDKLFEAEFTLLVETAGKPLSRCGVCLRFMQYISSKPIRLICTNCNVTYKAPQKGTLRAMNDAKCPFDNFELVVYTAKNGTSYHFCPRCYNVPPIGYTETFSCLNCPKEDCKYNPFNSRVFVCHKCSNAVILNSVTKPKWSLLCVSCLFTAYLCEGASSITVLKETCEECESYLLKVKYNKNSPWPEGEMKGCIWCTDAIRQLSTLKDDNEESSRGHAKRGRGRGRRRGRGRGRGRKY
jgi:DNA topoisomerase-3